MSENIWAKAAAGAFALLALIATWGVKKVYEVDIKVTRIEAKLDIWTTPLAAPPGDRSALDDGFGLTLISAPYQRQQGLDFAQRSMVRAAEQILQNDAKAALKTLLIGLEETGLRCVPVKDHLECR